MRWHQRARSAIKDVAEMPDHQADRLLRSMEQIENRLQRAGQRDAGAG